MAVPLLVTTPGGIDSNSYATTQDLQDYAERRPHAPTLPATDDELRALLLQAMVLIETMEAYGTKTAQEGALLYPRSSVLKKDGANFYDAYQIPQDLISGQCEIALSYIEEDVMSPADMAGFEKIGLGLDFVADPSTEPGPISDTVNLYLNHLFYDYGAASGSGSASSTLIARV